MKFTEHNHPLPAPPADPACSIDMHYLTAWLIELLKIHSPTGYTDPVTRKVVAELDRLGVRYEMTRRGAIRATLSGKSSGPARAIVSHLDTLGAMVRELKPNGRLGIRPIGTWSSRFAEGSRVSIFTDDEILRGTILPLKASGHIFNTAIDTQPVSWDDVEVRVDARTFSKQELLNLGVNVGDFIGVDSSPELLENGFINARHLDNKAGVAVMLAVIKHLVALDEELPTDLYFLFTISEEVGSGASSVLRGDISEMITVDNGTVGPGQESSEHWLSVCLADSSGPFDYHLSRKLLWLCKEHQILHGRDTFRYYRSDSASAVEAGNDIRTSLVTFGVDSSHGYERTHLECLEGLARLLVAYSSSEPLFIEGDKDGLIASLDDFPETRQTSVHRVNPESLLAADDSASENGSDDS